MKQREIKFRAWHLGHGPKHPPRMFYEDVMRPGECFKWQWEGQPVVITETVALKDRHGKDMYEGDVVSLPGFQAYGEPPDGERSLCVVEFRGYSLCYVEYYGSEGGVSERIESVQDLLGMGADIDEDAEIIGNVFENPELLEP